MNDGFIYISQYIESKCSLAAKIAAIDALIEAMELKMLDTTAGAIYDEYQMDDGQMKVRTKFRSVQDVADGITALEGIARSAP